MSELLAESSRPTIILNEVESEVRQGKNPGQYDVDVTRWRRSGTVVGALTWREMGGMSDSTLELTVPDRFSPQATARLVLIPFAPSVIWTANKIGKLKNILTRRGTAK